MNDDIWYGLTPTGQRVMISHKELMGWALQHERQFEVGWSHSFVDPNGVRLVRGPRKIAEARAKGWDDLAKALTQEYKAGGEYEQLPLGGKSGA